MTVLMDYFWFLGQFAVGPRSALSDRWSTTLLLFAVMGAVLGAVIVRAGQKMGAIEHSTIERCCGSKIAQIVTGRWSFIVWPLVSLCVVVVTTILLHATAAGWHSIRTTLHLSVFEDRLGGTWRDTTRALLAFTAFFSPLFALVCWLTCYLPKNRAESGGGALLAISFIAYLFLALSGAHPHTDYLQAVGAVTQPFLAPLFMVMIALQPVRWLLKMILKIRSQ